MVAVQTDENGGRLAMAVKGAPVRQLVTTMLVIVAIIHLLPLSGVIGGARLSALYGIPLDEPNLTILMRHRAVLFGLLGGLLLYAAFRPAFQPAAFIAGFASVLSFLCLAWSVGSYNQQVGRVVTADVVAFVCLIVGATASAYRPHEG